MRSTVAAGAMRAKSTPATLREVTQRSPCAWSIIAEVLSIAPRKSPACTKIRETAKATPAMVMAHRNRPCSSILRVRSTIGPR